jgi:hypothetical protein
MNQRFALIHIILFVKRRLSDQQFLIAGIDNLIG